MSAPEQSARRENPYRQSETVVYINSRPRRVTHLEANLRAWRQEQGLQPKDMIKATGVGKVSYHYVETGNPKASVPSVNRVIDFIGENGDEHNIHAVNAVTLLTALKMPFEERSTINDLVKASEFKGTVVFRDAYITEDPHVEAISEEMSFRDALATICDLTGTTVTRLARDAKIHPTVLQKLDRTKTKVASFTANKLIQTLGLEGQGKTAQYLRLKAQEQEPMSLEELSKANLGELIRYLRTAQGLTRPELGSILYMSKSTIENMENGTYNTLDDISPLRPWIGDDPIIEFLDAKIHKRRLDRRKRSFQKVLKGKFLFRAEQKAE
jgi:DNA-binding XRE family transcriptional regulator